MKYPSSEYAKYLIGLRRLTPADQKSSLKKFVAMLQKNGDLKNWQKIAEVYESMMEKTSPKKTATIDFAGELPKAKIEEMLKDYDVVFKEDPKIIGGIRIKIGNVRVDNSIAGRLNELKKVLK